MLNVECEFSVRFLVLRRDGDRGRQDVVGWHERPVRPGDAHEHRWSWRRGQQEALQGALRFDRKGAWDSG